MPTTAPAESQGATATTDPRTSLDAGKDDAGRDSGRDAGSASAAMHFVVDVSRGAGFRAPSRKMPIEVFVETLDRFGQTAEASASAYGLTTFPRLRTAEPTACSTSADCASDEICSNQDCEYNRPSFCSSLCESDPDPGCYADCTERPTSCATGRCPATAFACRPGGGSCGAQPSTQDMCAAPVAAFCTLSRSRCPESAAVTLPIDDAHGVGAIHGALAGALPGGAWDPTLAYIEATKDAVAFADSHPERPVSIVIVRSEPRLPTSEDDPQKCGPSLTSLVQRARTEHRIRTFVLALTSRDQDADNTPNAANKVAAIGGTGAAHIVTCNASHCSDYDKALADIVTEAKTR